MQKAILLSLNVPCLLSLFLSFISPEAYCKPSLQNASHYQQKLAVKDYLISEKYDGFRAYWNGEQLISRTGRVFAAPGWFIKALPKSALDGELWLGRGRFSKVASIVSKDKPLDQEWRRIRYMVFDLPKSQQPFIQRYQQLKALLKDSPEWIQLAPQWQLHSEAELMQQLADFTQQGAEGLMLHRKQALYKSGRSLDLLKLKISTDDEAIVLAHLPGKGKFSNMMGSLKVRNSQGKVFRIGSGFSHRQRKNPPAIGQIITYQYTGLSENGLPRFARFLRERKAYQLDKPHKPFLTLDNLDSKP